MAKSMVSMMEMDNDEEDEALYHDGHWEWVEDQLQYVSHLQQAKSFIYQPETSGTVEFKAELDVLEQRRFQKRFQKKSDDTSVVTLQDIKDLVLFTAPQHLVTVMLVNALHAATTERFLRALIFYCGYYLQVLNIMKYRTKECVNKIPTDNSKRIEEQYRDNLTDLRILVGREYFAMILGSQNYNNFHHMGRNRNQQSMTKRDRFFYEALIPFSCQIVWIALSRREHTIIKVRSLILGRYKPVLRTQVAHTPLFEEFDGKRDEDYRMFALGLIKYDDLDCRLKYFEDILSVPESMFPERNINLGIIGLPRRQYDITLIKIPGIMEDVMDSSTALKQGSKTSRMSRMSTVSKLSTVAKKSTSATSRKSIDSAKLETQEQIPYKRFEMPPRSKPGPLPEQFPSKPMKHLTVDKSQQRKWVIRATAYQRKLACHLAKKHKYKPY